MTNENLKTEKRQSPRVRPFHANPLSIAIQEQKEQLMIDDISVDGLGIRRASFLKVPSLKSTLRGELIYEQKKIALELKVVRVGTSTIGASFLSHSDELDTLIGDLIVQERDALRLLTVNQQIREYFTTEEAWWHATGGNELLVLSKEGHVTRFYFLLKDFYIEGKSFGELKGAALTDDGRATDELSSEIPAIRLTELRWFIDNMSDLPEKMGRILRETLENDEATVRA